jgi:predicted phage baseplate assembly protein
MNSLSFDALPISAGNRPALARVDYAAEAFADARERLLARLPQALPGWNATLATEGGDYAAALAELFAQLIAIHNAYADQRANEGWLRTATLHRSLIDLCQLIDYRLGAGASAMVLQAFFAKPDKSGVLPAHFKLNAAPIASARDRTELVFETLAPLHVHPSRNQMRLAGYNRSGRQLLLRASGSEPQDSAVLLDALYPGLKAGLPIAFDDGTHLLALPLAAATEQAGASHLRWTPGAAAQDRDFAIADLQLLARPKQAMRLAAAERADEITLGQNMLTVANATMFTVGAAVLIASGGLLMPALVLAKSTLTGSAPAGSITLNRGVVASLRRSATRVYEGTACGAATSTQRAGQTFLLRDSLGKKKDFPHTPGPGDLLLAADASGVELLTVASASGLVITLTQPLLRALRPVAQTFDGGVARVRYYMVSLNNPATHQTTLRPMLLQELAGVYAAGRTVLALDKTYDALAPQAVVAYSDGQQTGALRVFAAGSTDGKTTLTLQGSAPGSLRVATLSLHGPFEHTMRVAGYDHSELTLPAGASQLDIDGAPLGLVPGQDIVIADAQRREGHRITQVSPLAGGHTRIALARPLEFAYALGDAIVYGNVAAVTHGASMPDEVLGSGDPSAAPQRFALRRTPLAFVADAAAPRGVAPAVQVWIAGERWTSVDTLAASGPLERHYTVEIDDREIAWVVFGDGTHGATPPSGRNNIVARYRSGHGVAANVALAAIAGMPQPAPFLERSVNVLAASGGADREAPADAKRRAGHRVRTLERAVSLSDYADLALTVSGMAKARADIEREGSGAASRRVIAVTCAAQGGTALATPQMEALLVFLAARCPEPARLRVRGHRAWPIRLALRVNVAANFAQAVVQRALLDAFGVSSIGEAGEPAASGSGAAFGFFAFDRRELGSDLALSDVYAAAEAVTGVDHVLATLFHAEGEAAQVADRIRVPADALATGGDAVDATVGRLTLQLVGGLA